MRIKSPLVAAIVILLTPVAVGCGGDDNGASDQAAASTATATATATAAATAAATEAAADTPTASHALTIRMTEFAFDPSDVVAKKGKVTITAPNDGNDVHELVLLKTDADPANLPKSGDKIDESTSVGEIADVEPGSTKSAKFTLAPGKYAMVCALPGHYEGGMYGSLTVK